MKGLLLKDLYMIKTYFRTFIAIAIIFIICSFWGGGNIFLIVYPMIVLSMLSMSLLSYDEKFRWNIYCDALPCTRAQAVSEKYIICLLCITAMVIPIALGQLIRIDVRGESMSEFFGILAVLLTIGFAGPSLMMPVVFKLGAEKGRIAYYIIIGAICALAFILPKSALGSAGTSLALLPLLAVAAFGVSWLLSIRFYQKREL